MASSFPQTAFLIIYFFSLPKTFSMNPFHGQYPNIAIRINATVTNPTTQRKIPSVKEAKSLLLP